MKYSFNLKSIDTNIAFNIPALGNEENIKQVLDDILYAVDRKIQLRLRKLHEECNNFIIGLISLEEFAKKLDTPVSTIRTWKQRGELPSFLFKKVGGTIFVREKRIPEWVDSDT